MRQLQVAEVMPDAGRVVTPPLDEGCGCRTTGPPDGLGMLGLVLLVFGFAARNCIVFGTALAAAEVQDLRVASEGRVSLAVCDIARPDAASAWASGVSDALDGAGLDILISNVGICTPGPIDTLPLDAIRHTFEMNVFGALTAWLAPMLAFTTDEVTWMQVDVSPDGRTILFQEVALTETPRDP